jgi:hypothetical protein
MTARNSMFERNNRNANTIGTPGTAAIAERPATGNHQVPEFIDPFFTKNKPKTLVFND